MACIFQPCTRALLPAETPSLARCPMIMTRLHWSVLSPTSQHRRTSKESARSVKSLSASLGSCWGSCFSPPCTETSQDPWEDFPFESRNRNRIALSKLYYVFSFIGLFLLFGLLNYITDYVFHLWIAVRKFSIRLHPLCRTTQPIFVCGNLIPDSTKLSPRSPERLT